ncbi:MAG: tRNA (N6-isopentenyl adenosine(37)-C2)-methylthiotransferase MiaB [Candidatus Uhrbacteria bacterium]
MDAPKYHLITLGCQMNKNDSERMDAILSGVGFVSTERKEEADLILVNTCSVRQSAEDRVFGFLREFDKLKLARPNLIVGITGCLPGRDRDGAIRKKMPTADLYFPITDVVQLPRWISELRPELVNGADIGEDYLKVIPERRTFRQGFVTIQTGCNKFCTYCVVPFARGLEKNRTVVDILTEVRDLADHGCVEITLLGQTVNSFRAPDPESFSTANPYKDHFAALLWEVNQVAGISRLHYTAPHPLHMSDEAIDAMTLPAHLNYIHLPVQAGDDAVLKRMNRRYTSAQFLDVVRRLREKIPGLAIGTDIIVGFCGESREQYLKTAELYEQVRFDISYTARYSTRSGTAAWRAFKDDVDGDEKKWRWKHLQDIQERIVFEKNQAYVGKVVSVLVERHEVPVATDEMLELPGNILDRLAKMPGTCLGNSREMKLVRFPGGKELLGQIVNVRVAKAEKWILDGEIV